MDIIDAFEKKLAKYCGSNYGVAIDNCTNAIFLSLEYLKSIGEIKEGDDICIPSKTFVAVPMMIKHAGLNVKFRDINWSGEYNLLPTRIWDSATRFTKDMHIKDSLQCLSFQYRKILKMGRGGMILTNEKDAKDWLMQARFYGRHVGISRYEDKHEILGWNMYMLPEYAARGMTLFSVLSDNNDDCGCQDDYPDLSKQEIFK